MPPLALIGTVTKAGVMQKTVTVTVQRKLTHPIIGKVMTRTKKYLVHDPDNVCKLGNKVVIQNCAPISARKRFQFRKTLQEDADERRLEERASEGDPTLQSHIAHEPNTHQAA